MSKEELLRKCIEKARGSGYFLNCYESPDNTWCRNTIDNGQMENIILSSSFCKAFFGDKVVCGNCGKEYESDTRDLYPICKCNYAWCFKWQYHGQQMFIAPDRLEYLEQFLGEKV